MPSINQKFDKKTTRKVKTIKRCAENLPSEKNAINLLIMSGCSKQVVEHCRSVASLAVKIAETCVDNGNNVNVQLVLVGALLHDIGRSRTHSVDHVITGSKVAKNLNLPVSVISIIERHAGGGISMDEAKKLGWPIKHYIPQTFEEKIVTYADKLIEGTRRVNIERTAKKLSNTLGERHPTIRRIRKLHQEFSPLIKKLDASQDIPP